MKFWFPCDDDESEFCKYAKALGIKFKNTDTDIYSTPVPYTRFTKNWMLVTNPPFLGKSHLIKRIHELCGNDYKFCIVMSGNLHPAFVKRLAEYKDYIIHAKKEYKLWSETEQKTKSYCLTLVTNISPKNFYF